MSKKISADSEVKNIDQVEKKSNQKIVNKQSLSQLTKLGRILRKRGMSQSDFIQLIEEKTKIIYSKSRISNYCNKNKVGFLTTDTASILAFTLGVSLDDIVDGFPPTSK